MTGRGTRFTRAAVIGLTLAALLLAGLGGCDPEQLIDTTPPASPSDLAASAVDDSRIQLSWTDNSDNEDHFQIQRGVGSGYLTIDQVGPDSNAYLDSGLESDTSYTYRLRATNVAGESNWTSDAVATTGTVTSYTVTYWGNGFSVGIVPSDGASYQAGDPVTVVDSGSMTLSGSTFVGWNTESGGGGTSYGIGSIFLMPAADVDLYAQWTTNPTFTVTYHGNGADGGDVPTDPNVYETGTMAPVFGPGSMTRDGYSFVEWNTLPAGTGVSREAGDDFMMGSADVDLYAQWEEAEYLLYVQAGFGGTIAEPMVSPVSARTGDTVTIVAEPGEHYSFDRWVVSMGGATIADQYDPSTSLTVGETTVVVTASFFTLDDYELTVLADTGGTIEYPLNTQPRVDHGVPTRIAALAGSGSTFDHWEVTAGVATIAAVGSADTTVVLENGDATVLACFSIATYELTVSASDGGSIAEPPSSPFPAVHGQALDIVAEADPGHTFTGWEVVAGVVTIADVDAASTTVILEDGNASITANFLIDTYGLSVDSADGGWIAEPSSSPVAVEYGAETTISAIAASTDWLFDGWIVTSGEAIIANPSLSTTTVRLESGDAAIEAQWRRRFGLANLIGALPAGSGLSVCAQHIDNDGLADVVVGLSSGDYVFDWYQNIETGSSVRYHGPVAASVHTQAVLTARLGGSYQHDILVANTAISTVRWYENSSPDWPVEFTSHSLETYLVAQAVVSACIDGDSLVDVVAGSHSGVIRWFRNYGTGSFSAAIDVGSGADGLRSIAPTDIDADADTDLVAACTESDSLFWYENNGNGRFTTRGIPTSVAGQSSICATDIDGNGSADLVAGSSSQATVAWYQNDGAGTFIEHIITDTASGVSCVVPVDIDCDTDIDLVAALPLRNAIVWYENDGSGGFAEHEITHFAANVRSIDVIDIYGDGDLDVVAVDLDSVDWYENTTAE